jgi:two-component system, LuxR family, response regulator FixJ
MTDPVVFVVDDDDDVRESMRVLLEAAGFTAKTFGSAGSFLDSDWESRTGALLADIRMPDMDGLTLQAELARRKSSLPVIIMTGHGDVPLAVRAMKAGAIDFLEKPVDDSALVASIKRALDAAQASLNASAEAHDAASRIAALTDREKQVMDLMAAGRPNKIIAYELDISPRTVEIHRARVMEKMHAKSLAELVRMVVAAQGQ